MDELPRNAVGKVVPRMLPKPWEDGGEGEGGSSGAGSSGVGTSTDADGAQLVGQDRLRPAG